MKRIQLEKTSLEAGDRPLPYSGDIADYVSQLTLLYHVPFPYLVTEEKFLPPESIRFFCLDQNWAEEYVKGALSVGRASHGDARRDQAKWRTTAPAVRRQLPGVRLGRMHENHKQGLGADAWNSTFSHQTGFLMRSVLVRRWKGFEIIGRDGGKDLAILRMETLSDDIVLCLFDGVLTDLVIAEPQTGLRFGAPDTSGVIHVRSTKEDDTFGTDTGKTVDFNSFVGEQGKVDIAGLAGSFASCLGEKAGSARLAYELIATAHRAEFYKGMEG